MLFMVFISLNFSLSKCLVSFLWTIFDNRKNHVVAAYFHRVLIEIFIRTTEYSCNCQTKENCSFLIYRADVTNNNNLPFEDNNLLFSNQFFLTGFIPLKFWPLFPPNSVHWHPIILFCWILKGSIFPALLSLQNFVQSNGAIFITTLIALFLTPTCSFKALVYFIWLSSCFISRVNFGNHFSKMLVVFELSWVNI